MRITGLLPNCIVLYRMQGWRKTKLIPHHTQFADALGNLGYKSLPTPKMQIRE